MGIPNAPPAGTPITLWTEILISLRRIEDIISDPTIFNARRVTLAAGATFMFDNGIKPNEWVVSVESGTNGIVAVYLGSIAASPFLQLSNLETARFPAQDPTLLLANVGANPVNFTVAAVQGKARVEIYRS